MTTFCISTIFAVLQCCAHKTDFMNFCLQKVYFQILWLLSRLQLLNLTTKVQKNQLKEGTSRMKLQIARKISLGLNKNRFFDKKGVEVS